MSLKISRVLHAGYIFEFEDSQILFDPIFENPFSKNCFSFPSVKFDSEKIKCLKFKAVFISHFHDDHCSLESLNLLDRNTPIYIYCIYEELFTMIKELGFKFVFALKIDVSIRIDSFEITPRRALDVDVDSLFQIQADGLNILNVVDSWIDDATMDLLVQNGPWDMVLWPFQTMREIEVLAPSRSVAATGELPQEWISQLKILNPRYIVPSSCQFVQEKWSWYNQSLFPITYEHFKNEIESVLPKSHVVRMNPSVSVVLDKNAIQESTSLNWIQTVGDQNVDYDYQALIKPPTTAEISKFFDPLSLVETEHIFSYCREGLIKKYKSLEPSEDSYFHKSRAWKLSVYDHNKNTADFYYYINKNDIIFSLNKIDKINWFTEIPISKFYAALEFGEALTSLYMRINDTIFDADTEIEIVTADIMDDPLIRCLFNGFFGAYQKAQLKRLKGLAYTSAQ